MSDAMMRMKTLFEMKLGPRRQPYFALYWASPKERFTHPGLHVWAFRRHWRVLPLPSESRLTIIVCTIMVIVVWTVVGMVIAIGGAP